MILAANQSFFEKIEALFEAFQKLYSHFPGFTIALVMGSIFAIIAVIWLIGWLFTPDKKDTVWYWWLGKGM